MGFGYLLLGYIVTFIISLTASAMGLGSLALFVGGALMFAGLRGLCRFNTAFVPAAWLTFGVFAWGLCRLWQDAANWFTWQNPIEGVMTSVITWASFAVTLLLHLAILYAIRVLAMEVGLKKISSHAMYNTIGVGIWGALSLLCNMPSVGEAVLPYLSFSMVLFNLTYLISDIALLMRCAKNICAEGDEEVAPKPSRFAFINRMSESYSRTMENFRANSRADGEAIRHRYEEKKQQKNSKKKK
jgi:hypothetical protein